MQSSRRCKKLLAVILAVGCAVGMTACGGKKEGESPQPPSADNTSGADMVYAAQSQPVEIPDIRTVKVSGDVMYFAAGKWEEGTEEYIQEIYKLKTGETVPDKLSIVLENNTYVNGIQPEAESILLLLIDDTNNYFLKRYGADGTELMHCDLSGLGQNIESFYINYMTEDGQGNIYLSDSENNIWIVSKEGAVQGRIANDNWVNALFTLPNGNAAVSCLGNNGESDLNEIDVKAKKYGKTYGNLPEECRHFAAGRENTILAMGNNKVYEYDILQETYLELLNWTYCDIDGNNISDISMLEDGGILAVLTEWRGEAQNTELVYLTKRRMSEAVQKETIILGTTYLNEDVKRQVLVFNQKSNKYHVEIKEYGNGDRAAGETLMDAEIAAGGGPDLFDLTYIGDVDKYLSKGVLEELDTYIDADEEIKREDYVENVLNAYQKDDKIYCIVPGFMISTVIGKTSDVGDEQGWTIDDVIALMDSKPEGTELFTECTKSSVLKFCCTKSLENFVDWETGECTFHDGYFEKVLEFADRFPKEVTGDESVPAKIQSGKQLLREEALFGVGAYQMHCQLFGGPVTCIGYPVVKGSGTFIMPNRIFGINAKSKVKDGAWEFLKTFLTEDYQKEQTRMVFPVLQSVLDAEFEEAMTPEYQEENGKQVEVPKHSWRYAEWEAEAYAATKEQVDVIKTLIETADGVYSYHQEIAAIIEEEAAPFFEGQKGAKEVADIVQSRVQIYVDENRK